MLKFKSTFISPISTPLKFNFVFLSTWHLFCFTPHAAQEISCSPVQFRIKNKIMPALSSSIEKIAQLQ